MSIRRERHSYDIIRRTGEFVINLTTEELARATDWCGVRSAATATSSPKWASRRARRRGGRPHGGGGSISIECRVRQVLPLGSHDMFLAEWSMCRPTNATSTPADASDFERARPWSTPTASISAWAGRSAASGGRAEEAAGPRGERVGARPCRRFGAGPRCRSASLRCPDRPDRPDRPTARTARTAGPKPAGPRCRKERAAAVRRVRNADNPQEYALRYAPYFRFLSHGHRAPHGRRHRPGFSAPRTVRLRPGALRGVARHPAARGRGALRRPVYGGGWPCGPPAPGQLKGRPHPRRAGRALRQPLRGPGAPRAGGCGVRPRLLPVAAAACVGEHSYSSHRWPIARGVPMPTTWPVPSLRLPHGRPPRPHGAPRGVRLRDAAPARNPLLATLRFARFVLRYRRARKRDPRPLLPVTDAARCTACGRCVALCPAEAIAPGDELHTDPARCIRCCACVKGCPAAARSYDSPFAPVLSRLFRSASPMSFRCEDRTALRPLGVGVSCARSVVGGLGACDA